MIKLIDQLEVFPWNKNFETGIEIIDEQHQKLISLLNELAGALVRGDQLEINYFFDALAKYAEFHFQTEEAIWVEYFGDDSWLLSHQLNYSSFAGWPSISWIMINEWLLSFKMLIKGCLSRKQKSFQIRI